MTPKPNLPGRQYGKLTEAFRLIEGGLAATEALMLSALQTTDPFLNEIIRHGILLGGKRLRPALVLLSGKVFHETLTPNHFRTAAAVEMIHTGTLIHDDILDGAVVRRNLPTLNTRWDAEVSVLAGDVLFMQAMKLISESECLFGYRELSNATNQTCEGELRQIGTRGRFDLTEAEYRCIIAGKTAALMTVSCVLGAYYSSEDAFQKPSTETLKTLESFRRFGQHLGVAFQMADDIMDWMDEEAATGKTMGTDFEKRKPTLPLILFLRNVNDKERKEVHELLNQNGQKNAFEMLRSRLIDSGAIENSRQTLLRELADARNALSPFNGDAVNSLLAITEQIG